VGGRTGSRSSGSVRTSYRLVYAALIVLAAAVLAWLMVQEWGLGRIDNGDGWRVLRRAFVFDSQRWIRQPLLQSYEMAPLTAQTLMQALPKATSGLIVFVIALGCKALGLKAFPAWLLTTSYVAIYLAGAACWLRQPQAFWRRLALALLFAASLVNPYTASYLHSFYEEAAVCALLPWWSFTVHQAFAQPGASQRRRALYVASGLMVLSKTQMLPVLLPVLALHAWHLKRITGPLLMLLAVALFSASKGMHQHETYNAFNRLNNGLAYSVSGVSQWPATDQAQRLAQAHQQVHWSSGQALGLPTGIARMWGGSFWPDAETASPTERDLASEAGKLPAYARLLATHPSAAWQLLTQPYLTAAKADYTTAYLFMNRGKVQTSVGPSPWQWLMARLGGLYVLALAVLVWALYKRQHAAATMSLIVLVSPLFTVLGDGYFEFERHLLPYLAVSTGVAASLLYRGQARATSGVMRDTPGQASFDHQPDTRLHY
jgi:hypothetical protein